MKALANKIESLVNESRYDKACEVLQNKFNFQLNIIGVEFKSMPWDKDKQKRNVFNCELVRNNKKYSFEFGSSVIDSCDYVSEYTTLKPKDKIEFYAGLQSNKISVGKSFKLSLEELENLEYDFVEDEANKLKISFEQQAKDYNDEINKKFAKEYARSAGLYVNVSNESGMFIQCIKKAIERKLNELKENEVLSKDLPLTQTPIEPTIYDVLSCLQKYPVGDFEEFCDDFGYDQDSREAERIHKGVLKEYEGISNLFSEEELEVLSLIN